LNVEVPADDTGIWPHIARKVVHDDGGRRGGIFDILTEGESRKRHAVGLIAGAVIVESGVFNAFGCVASLCHDELAEDQQKHDADARPQS
jgi:hypothetical protein